MILLAFGLKVFAFDKMRPRCRNRVFRPFGLLYDFNSVELPDAT